jgi:ABC-type oligopeptide transport system substrate-binding subunit/class 3 adenylate cyclase
VEAEEPAAHAEPAADSMPEERRVITVLFADLVGSTALAERLDPDETRLILAEAVRRVVEAVESYGGYVKDLAGDGVLAFFGAPVAHEDDAERAVLSGLRITAVLDEYGHEVERAWGTDPIAVRVGLNTGPVVLGPIGGGQRIEYAAFGDAVNVAARLQAAAEPSSVLVAEATRRLVEPLFAWTEPRELFLKGREIPVRACIALHPLAGAPRQRGPAAHARLVGREQELARLDEAVERVASGTGSVLLLTGEAGIGKSRLLQELRERFSSAVSPIGAPAWLEGRCVSYGESLSYWPFRDMLRDWLGVATDDPELRARIALRRRIDDLFGDRADEIYPYLGTMLELTLEPTALARVAELSPEALQYRTFEVIRLLFSSLAERGPVAIVIDDLHWADATSIQLAASLLGATDEVAVLLVVAMRSERDRPAWHFREQAAVQYPHRLQELSLEGLPAGAERELLEEMVGHGTLPASLEGRLLSEAEGNPFFLEELVRSIVDAGALVQADGAWRFDHEVELHVPDSVEQVILARIARLAPETRRVLTAAAVLGRHFSQPLLEHLVEMEGTIGQPLTDLQRLDLVRENRRWPQPEYRFKHALIQEAAYGTIVSANRRSLHRRAAEWLERRRDEGGDPALGLLAHHWLAAEDEEQAVHYLALAGDRARQSWSLDEAIGHYRALLPLLERRGERQAIALVLFKLALALHTALRFSEANEAYQRAFAHWTPPEPAARVDATLRIGAAGIPGQPDPPRSYYLQDMRLQMALFDRLVERWPEATIVPSLAERWEISDDGLQYRFRLREGLRWSDGVPLTARDVEFGVRRNLDPDRPAMSVGIFFALEGGQDYYLRRHADPERIGVHAIDDRTVEFRLAAPAPYFMSVVNRADAGPQPRHAHERHGDGWLTPENQVVSGAFRQAVRQPDRIELERRLDASSPRAGNVTRVIWEQLDDDRQAEAYRTNRIDMAEPKFSFTTETAVDAARDDLVLGAPAFLLSIAFDFSDPVARNRDVRLALAHAIDREALVRLASTSMIVATGGIVPPALQGHTPDIVPRFDPDRARELLAGSGAEGTLSVAVAAGGQQSLIEAIVGTWRSVLDLEIKLDIVDPQAWRSADDRFAFGAATIFGWFPGYPDPEYFLRLLLQSDSRDVTVRPEARYRSAEFDALIEAARQERDGPRRLELFHSADRMAVVEDVAMIPLVYARSEYLVKPWLEGWWEFGKSWTSFADLRIGDQPRDGESA